MADTVEGVEVRIGADTAQAKSGMDDAASSIASSLASINAALQNFGSANKSTMAAAVQNNADLSRSFLELKASATGGFNAIAGVIERFRGVLASLTIALAGGFLFKEAVSSALALEDAVRGLEIQFGMTSEAATQMALQLKIAGVSTETYEGMAQRLGVRLRMQQSEFDRLKIVYKDSAGNLLPLDQILKNVYIRMQDFKAGTDQQLFVMSALGRNAKDFANDMQRLEAAESDAAAMAKKFANEMGTEAQNNIEEYRRKVNEFDITLDHLKVTTGVLLIPVLEKLADWFTVGIEKITAGIGRLSLLNKVNLSQFEDSVVSVKEQLASLPGTVDSALAAMRKMEHAGPPIPGHGTEGYTPPPKGGDDRLAEWKAQLEQMKEAEGYFHELSYADEAAFWEKKLALVKGNGAKEVALRREIAHEIYDANKSAAHEEYEDSMALYAELIAAADGNKDKQLALAADRVNFVRSTYKDEGKQVQDALKEEIKLREEWAKKEEAIIKDAAKFHIEVLKQEQAEQESYLSGEVAAGRISADQKIQIERQMEAQIHAEELKELDAYIATLQVGTLAYQQAQEKRLAITIEFNFKMLQLAQQEEKEREQYALQADQAIQSSLGTLIDNLVNRTKTLKQTWQDFVKQLTQDLNKIATDQLMKQLLGPGTQGGSFLSGITSKIFGTGGASQAATEAANTTALTALTAALTANTAALTASSASGLGGLFGGGGGSSFGATQGGGISSLFSGPGLGSLLSLDTGTNYVPQTSLALVHRGEAVIPARYNNQSGKSLTNHNHFYISGGVDTRTMHQIAKESAAGVRKAQIRANGS